MKIVVVGDIHHGPNLEQIERAIVAKKCEKEAKLFPILDRSAAPATTDST